MYRQFCLVLLVSAHSDRSSQRTAT